VYGLRIKIASVFTIKINDINTVKSCSGTRFEPKAIQRPLV